MRRSRKVDRGSMLGLLLPRERGAFYSAFILLILHALQPRQSGFEPCYFLPEPPMLIPIRAGVTN